MPGSSFRGDLTALQIFKMIFTTCYCLLGLALIAMGIDLATEQVRTEIFKMIFTTCYCLLGLALIAMGIDLATEQVGAQGIVDTYI